MATTEPIEVYGGFATVVRVDLDRHLTQLSS